MTAHTTRRALTRSLALLIVCVSGISVLQAQPLSIDRTALAALYQATDGDSWTNNWYWLSDAPVSRWYGVGVSSSGWEGRVTSLNLSRNNLQGEIPVELGWLTRLEHLDLSDNNLAGQIPYNLGVGRLETFRVDNNPGLFGTLSIDLSKSRSLEVLSFVGTGICEPDDPDFQAWINSLQSSGRTGCIVSITDVVGNCDPAEAERYLDANNVRARILNNGGLFYRGEPHVYRVPRFSSSNAIFVAGIWIGGLVEGQLRVAVSRYGPYEFWAGPLDDDGYPPADCDLFDRIYKVNREEIEEYERSGLAVGDLIRWPTGLGAPTVDSNGNRVDLMHLPLDARRDRLIDLEVGERPDILGDQGLWWVMNDRGNTHNATDSPSLGIEVHGFAYAMSSSVDALNDATFYHYRMLNRNESAIKSAYFGIYFDPDLGGAGDDYIGTDTLRSIAYVYNADNIDLGGEGYGEAPPAVGFKILKGLIADDDDFDNNRNGLLDEPGERTRMSHTLFFYSGGGVIDTPMSRSDYYNYMRSNWKNGQPVTYGGNGFDRNTTAQPTNYFYPGDPVTSAYWSEMKPCPGCKPNPAADRRFLLSNGPFDLAPGQSKEIDFAIVYGRGKDHLDSITEMRHASDGVQAAFDSGFRGYPPGLQLEEKVQLISPANGVENQPTNVSLNWKDLTRVEGYQVEFISPRGKESFDVSETYLNISELDPNQLYSWRVRRARSYGHGPWSEWNTFKTGRGPVQGYPLLFSVVQNASGTLEHPDLALYSIPGSTFPLQPCPMDRALNCSRPTRGYQQATNESIWVISAGTSTGTSSRLGTAAYGAIVSVMTDRGDLWANIGESDYEWRWIGQGKGGLGYDSQMDYGMIDVGFEIWNIGIGTTNNPSDDYRMIPFVNLWGGGDHDRPVYEFNIGGDHIGYRGPDDPYTNYVTWYNPIDTSPGQNGYELYASNLAGRGDEVFRKTALVQVDGGSSPPYDVAFPEPGTVFRITHGKPLAPMLSAPANESMLESGPVHFYWSGLDSSYVMQLSERPYFSHTVFSLSNITPGITLPTEPKRRYYWRIFSDSTGWSEAWSFNTLESVRAQGDDRRVIEVTNYPNPFSDLTTVRFYLREPSQLQIEITDVLGRTVMTVLDEYRSPGLHVEPIETRHLAPGLYFYRLRAGDYVTTNSMIIVR